MNAKPLATPAHAFALAALLAAGPAPAAEIAAVPRFEAIELAGGGSVVVRHGAVQRVTLVEGSRTHSDIAVTAAGRSGPDRLVVRACRLRCPAGYRLKVEIVTPDVSAVSVSGGGSILVTAGFPGRGHLAAAVNGGGQIDLRGLAARDAAASVRGGGKLMIAATGTLAAAVNGGGAILYWGDPQVVSSVHGGGAVRRGE